MTPRKLLCSQFIGVSDPTLPATVTTNGSALHADSSKIATKMKGRIRYKRSKPPTS